MTELTQTEAEEKPCPQCGVPAEPEIDGSHLYYECQNDDCDTPFYTWGYQLIQTPDTDDCAIGVPESVRRQASAPAESVLATEAARQPVHLGTTIGRRPT